MIESANVLPITDNLAYYLTKAELTQPEKVIYREQKRSCNKSPFTYSLSVLIVKFHKMYLCNSDFIESRNRYCFYFVFYFLKSTITYKSSIL